MNTKADQMKRLLNEAVGEIPLTPDTCTNIAQRVDPDVAYEDQDGYREFRFDDASRVLIDV